MTTSPKRKGKILRPKGGDAAQRRGVYLLPNLFTTGGLFSGFYAVIATLSGRFELAATMILVAMIFDMLDGRIARLTGTTSRFGVEYDSLADLVAFGVAPGILAYSWALMPWGNWGWLAASLYVTCGALRLARFNVQVDWSESNSFQGLPIPAAAAVIASTILVYHYFGGAGATHKHITLLLLVFGLGALMVSNVPFPSFKEVHWKRRQPFPLLVGGVFLITVLIAEPQLTIFTSIVTYVLAGPILWAWTAIRSRDTPGSGQAAA